MLLIMVFREKKIINVKRFTIWSRCMIFCQVSFSQTQLFMKSTLEWCQRTKKSWVEVNGSLLFIFIYFILLWYKLNNQGQLKGAIQCTKDNEISQMTKAVFFIWKCLISNIWFKLILRSVYDVLSSNTLIRNLGSGPILGGCQRSHRVHQALSTLRLWNFFMWKKIITQLLDSLYKSLCIKLIKTIALLLLVCGQKKHSPDKSGSGAIKSLSGHH